MAAKNIKNQKRNFSQKAWSSSKTKTGPSTRTFHEKSELSKSLKKIPTDSTNFPPRSSSNNYRSSKSYFSKSGGQAHFAPYSSLGNKPTYRKDKADFKKAGFQKPEFKKAGFQKPEFKKAGFQKPEFKKSGVKKPEFKRSSSFSSRSEPDTFSSNRKTQAHKKTFLSDRSGSAPSKSKPIQIILPKKNHSSSFRKFTLSKNSPRLDLEQAREQKEPFKLERQRINQYLARCALGSRRECEQLIEEKRVRVNGSLVKNLGEIIHADDVVLVDSKRVRPKRSIYLAFHKPSGYLVSNKSFDNKKLAIDLVKPLFLERLFFVGRLDYMSSGLILLTNDGIWAQQLMRPEYQIEKEYQVVLKYPVDPKHLQELIQGYHHAEGLYRAKSYTMTGDKTLRLVLQEGKNQEIRKFFNWHNNPVKNLHRIRINQIKLSQLRPGEFRFLQNKEINDLIKSKKNIQ